MNQKTRLQFLDGLRGWAAFCVLLGHLGLTATEPMSIFWSFVDLVPLRLLMGGRDAVILFFLISGAALSHKFFIDHDIKNIIKMAQFRYIRIAIPVTLSVLFIYILLIFDLMADPSGKIFDTSFFGLLKNLYNSFFAYSAFAVYNPNLWTIPVEILGSFLIFSILCLFGTSKLRYVVYCLAVILLLKTFYVSFVIGLLVCDLYSQTMKLPLKKFQGHFIIDLLLLCFFFCRFPRDWLISEISLYISSIIFPTFHIAPRFCVIFSFVLVFVSPLLQSLFSSRVFLFLGRISFALYLFHWPIIWFIFSKNITMLIEKIFYKLNIITLVPWFQVSFCILSCILYAYFFTIFVEETLLKQIKNFMFSNELSFAKIKEWVFMKGMRLFPGFFLRQKTASKLSEGVSGRKINTTAPEVTQKLGQMQF